MSAPDLPEMMDLAIKHATTILVGNPGAEMSPVWCVSDIEGHLAIIVTPFIGEDSKELVAQAMRQMMRDMGAVRYTFATEAWVASGHSKLQPKHREDKIEAVMIVGADADGALMRGYEIERDWQSGTITALKPLDEQPGKASGRFADLLED